MNTGRYRETLPARYFYDSEHYGRELQTIWHREWICVGREEDWPQAGDYRRIRLGDQQIVVTRARDRALHAFHNTCRHRGAALCDKDEGHFENGRIVCPYHAWTYALSGELQRVPRAAPADDLRPGDLTLYRVALQTWRGFVFVNLAGQPGEELPRALLDEGEHVAAWPLEALSRVHRETRSLDCNWKIFWENYLECYHCPVVHPELCQLVPVYRTGYMDYTDAGLEPQQGRPHAMLRPGAVTWSADGTTELPWFEGLGDKERETGMTFSTFLPTLFIVAHVDYLRTVQVMPLGPEQTGLTIDWYVHRDVVGHPALDVERLTAFARQVVAEDGRVCELNQQGIRGAPHRHGILLGIEDYVYEFEQWVRDRVGD
jgi:Rieske 2Fe-2S family protein